VLLACGIWEIFLWTCSVNFFYKLEFVNMMWL
jgi:hypothetical protein